MSKTCYSISSSDAFLIWSWASVFGKVSYGRLTANDNASTMELSCDIDDVEYSSMKGNWEYLNKESRDPLIYQSLRWEKFLEDMNYHGCLQSIPPPVLAVTMIGSHGKAWRRMGIGHVFFKQWVKSRPSSRSFVLE